MRHMRPCDVIKNHDPPCYLVAFLAVFTSLWNYQAAFTLRNESMKDCIWVTQLQCCLRPFDCLGDYSLFSGDVVSPVRLFCFALQVLLVGLSGNESEMLPCYERHMLKSDQGTTVVNCWRNVLSLCASPTTPVFTMILILNLLYHFEFELELYQISILH